MIIRNTDNGKIQVSATLERGLIMSDFGRKALHRQLDMAIDNYYTFEYLKGADIPKKWKEDGRYGCEI